MVMAPVKRIRRLSPHLWEERRLLGEMRFWTGLALFLGLLVVPMLTWSAVYKWVDENGKTHFSDKPVSSKAKQIEVKPATPAASVEKERSVRPERFDDPNKLLLSAIRAGDRRAIMEALKRGALIDGQPKDSLPLHAAIASKKPKIVNFLIQQGANINAQDGLEQSPLHVAVKHKQDQVLSKLLQLGALTELRNHKGLTPLGLAAATDNVDAAHALSMNKVRLDAVDYKGQSPLMHAISNGNTKMVKFLLERNADSKHRQALGKTPLMIAAAKGEVDSLSLLLEHGAEVNARDNKGATALLEAAKAGSRSVAEMLIQAGASRKALNMKGESAMDIARTKAKVQLYPLLKDE